MSFLRMAGQALKPLLRGTGELIPKSAFGRAMTFGPDALFALASANAAPEGTPLLDRAGIAAFDAIGFGLLPSLGSRALARAGATRLAGVRDPERLEQVMQGAEFIGQAIPAFGMQNPLLNASFERAAKTQQQLEDDQRATEQRRQEEALLGSLALGTGIAATGLTPRAAEPIGDLFGYGGFG